MEAAAVFFWWRCPVRAVRVEGDARHHVQKKKNVRAVAVCAWDEHRFSDACWIVQIYANRWSVIGLLKYGDYGMGKSEHLHRIAKTLRRA
jgi:hypothetical protein